MLGSIAKISKMWCVFWIRFAYIEKTKKDFVPTWLLLVNANIMLYTCYFLSLNNKFHPTTIVFLFIFKWRQFSFCFFLFFFDLLQKCLKFKSSKTCLDRMRKKKLPNSQIMNQPKNKWFLPLPTSKWTNSW